MSLLAIIAALIMGFVLGLLGGGGSILAVPILVYLLGLGEKAAIATSLLVVGATGAMAAVSHARAGNVSWRTAMIFGAFSMAGAYIGGRLAAFIPGSILLAAFAVSMLIAAVFMLIQRPTVASGKPNISLPKLTAMGLGVGVLTGLIGAGGGFVIVPALVIFGGLPIRLAIGTSLTVIALKSLGGFIGYIGHQPIDYSLALTFVVASVVGTLGGTAVSRAIDAGGLRTGFAFFVLITGTMIFGAQLGWPLYLSIPLSALMIPAGLLLRRVFNPSPEISKA